MLKVNIKSKKKKKQIKEDRLALHTELGQSDLD